MKGSDYFTAVTSLVAGFSLDQTLFLQMLNTARTRRELQRAWMRLRKYQYSQTLAAASSSTIFPPTSKITVPTDFMFFSRDGEITLYDNNNQFETYTELPMEMVIPYMQNSNKFAIDHGAGFIYFLGIIAKQYTAFLQYQADLGDITLTTTWLNIPNRFNMILAYDVAAMYRLGVSYDDINARNADDNNKQAELLYGAMATWDDNLQRSATTRMDFPTIMEEPGANFNHRIDTDRGG